MRRSPSIKARVDAILDELRIERPEDLANLRELCLERGAYVRQGGLDSAEARLTVKGNKGVITVKQNESYGTRTRFSTAHELGHFELHCKGKDNKLILSCDQRSFSFDGFEPAVALEIEANRFASELLMPARFLLPELRQSKPSFRYIESISHRYQTSFFASTRRFLELTNEACAAVFFRGGYVEYVWRSKLFERQQYQIHRMLDPYTFAFEAAMVNEVPDYMATVSASAWFEIASDFPLLEEARYYRSIGLGMALLWLNRPQLLSNR